MSGPDGVADEVAGGWARRATPMIWADVGIGVLAALWTVGVVSVLVAAVSSLGFHPAPVVWLAAAAAAVVVVAVAVRVGGLALWVVGVVVVAAVLVVAVTHPQWTQVVVDPPLAAPAPALGLVR